MTRRHPMRVHVPALYLAVALGAGASQAAAMDGAPGPVRKLGRGLANATTGLLEIPLSMSAIGKKEGPIAGLFLGLILGTGTAVARTLVGVAETITFPIPFAGVGYGPLLEPEFLLHPSQPHSAYGY